MAPGQVAHAILVVRGGRGLTTTDYYLGGVVMVLEVVINLHVHMYLLPGSPLAQHTSPATRCSCYDLQQHTKLPFACMCCHGKGGAAVVCVCRWCGVGGIGWWGKC